MMRKARREEGVRQRNEEEEEEEGTRRTLGLLETPRARVRFRRAMAAAAAPPEQQQQQHERRERRAQRHCHPKLRPEQQYDETVGHVWCAPCEPSSYYSNRDSRRSCGADAGAWVARSGWLSLPPSNRGAMGCGMNRRFFSCCLRSSRSRGETSPLPPPRGVPRTRMVSLPTVCAQRTRPRWRRFGVRSATSSLRVPRSLLVGLQLARRAPPADPRAHIPHGRGNSAGRLLFFAGRRCVL